MALVDVTQVLISAQNPDERVRSQAEEAMKQLQASNYPSFMASMSAELSNPTKPADSRRLAGLVLKNALDAKEDARKRELQNMYTQLDPTLRQHIRDALLATLSTDAADVRHTAAMVLAKVAAIDLPRKEWPTLVQSLLNNMSAQPVATGTRQATLEAMGYVCEEMNDIPGAVLSRQEIDMILTAVVSGMAPTEPSELRLAATIALGNAIEFAEHNFENDNERNYLMQVVCQGTQAEDIKIRVASFECLHEIASLYYGKMVPYMTEIYNLTVKAIKGDQEDVALQALEFWNSVAEEELTIIDDADADVPCHNFMRAAAPHLVPMLLEQLTKQEEGQEQDPGAWNLSVAAGMCLGFTAQVIRDDIFGLVMPFIQANISKTGGQEDWRLREAATFAFGLILDGPRPDMFKDTIKQALGFLLQAVKDPHPHVRDTTAWTIGRMFEFLHGHTIEPPIITPDALPVIMTCLVEALKDQPHVVYRVCCAISQLAAGFKNNQGTSPMSPFFKDTVAALLQCAQTHANYEHAMVQISAYEAINDMVRAASLDTADVVAQLIQVVLPKIHATLDMQVTSAEAKEKRAEVQAQLCGVLTVIIQKLAEEDQTKIHVQPHSDKIMETILRIFSSDASTVHEEAMLVVGAFTYSQGKQFNKYLQAFVPFLITGLTNHKEIQVCLSTVGVLGDICRNVEEGILPYCDQIMGVLIHNLGSEDVHRDIKPQILAVFGDIALGISDKYDKYLDAVLRVLKQAMSLSVESARLKDEDYVDYNNMLRTGIIDAYSGITQGLGPMKAPQCLRQELPAILEFLSSIGAEIDTMEPDEDVIRAAINMLGDLCSCMQDIGSILRDAQSKEWEQIVGMCRHSESLQSDTAWAITQVEHVMRM